MLQSQRYVGISRTAIGNNLKIRYTNSACTQTHSRDEIPLSTLVKTKASSIKREAAMAIGVARRNGRRDHIEMRFGLLYFLA